MICSTFLMRRLTCTWPSFCGQVAFLKSGESRELCSFARLRIRNTTLNVMKMTYTDFANVLKEMDFQARQYLEQRGKK